MLRYLFLDMNSFFASVEQQDRPELRGRAVGVVASWTDRTCCIAASYEAKAHGVKTGTAVREARQRCPTMRFALARPSVYVRYHHRIIEAVERCIHVERVCSIDEMYGRLYRNEHDPAVATALARRIKAAIGQHVGPWVRCSIGIGPNVWLAKVATDLQKPDGLVIVESGRLPQQLAPLKLTDLPGIARRMQRRLERHGVRTVEQLYAQSVESLRRVSGSHVWAQLWHAQLRGEDLPFRPTHRRTVGHSHVLPPDLRNDARARAVLVRMIHKAAARLRRLGYWAGCMIVTVKHRDRATWQARASLGLVRDTLSMVRAFSGLWPQRPSGTPLAVGVVLTHLVADALATQPLFAEERRLGDLADAMDRITTRFGVHSVYLGAMHGYQQTAPVRISYTQIPSLAEFSELDR